MDDPYLVERVDAVTSTIKNFYKRNKVIIVDAGCGGGRATVEIIRKFEGILSIENFYAIDIEPPLSVKELRTNISIIKHDFNQYNLPLHDGSVDIVYSIETIEHVVNPDIFIKEINRILKPNGLVILTTPNLLAWYNRILVLFGSLPIHYEISKNKKYGRFKYISKGEVVGHIRVFSTKALKEMLEDNSFKILQIKGLRFIYSPWWLSFFDNIFKKIPSFASTFLIVGKKKR